MTESTRNFSYQLYFLFRTRWWKATQEILEPAFSPTQFGALGEIGIQVDRDKRLFCYTFVQKPLESWKNSFQSS